MPDRLILPTTPPAAANGSATGPRAVAVPSGRTSGAAGSGAAATDDALLAGLRSGDSAAGDALVRRYAGPLLRYLQRLAGEEAAEELHQQTWISVLDNLGRFEPDRFEPRGDGPADRSGAFKAWLFRIATNKANDLWRTRGRERAMRQNLRLVTEEEAPAAGHRIEGREADEALAKAIERLPEGQRQILALRYYGGLKFTEIAQLLGCPLNTALGRVHKALAKLRRTLEE